MDSQLKRGLIEASVLSLLMRGDSYGYLLIQDLNRVMEVSESTLYPVLRRLESTGALTVRSAEHNGRLRKYYAITEKGKERIRDFLEEWQDVNRVYEFILRESSRKEEIES